MVTRRPVKPRRSRVGQNIVDNTPASGWRLATKREKQKLDVNPNEPRYVRKGVRVRKNDPINLTRDEFTKKAFGLHRRKLAEVRATEEGAAHPRYGYKRPLSEKMRELIRSRRRLALVREARRTYERRGVGACGCGGSGARNVGSPN
jgi:hypothetical protein